jgi:hypothetical protein
VEQANDTYGLLHGMDYRILRQDTNLTGHSASPTMSSFDSILAQVDFQFEFKNHMMNNKFGSNMQGF